MSASEIRIRLKMHCPAVQNIRSSESNQARCTIAHRVQRKAYLLLRRPVPFGRDASDSTAIRPAAAAVLAAVSCTTTGALHLIPLLLATSKMACSLLQGLRRPGHNSSVHAAAGSSFPAAAGSSATRGRRLSAATGRVAALRCHRCFPASDLRPGVCLKKSNQVPGSCKGLCCTMVQIRFGFGFHTVIWVQTVWNLVCT